MLCGFGPTHIFDMHMDTSSFEITASMSRTIKFVQQLVLQIIHLVSIVVLESKEDSKLLTEKTGLHKIFLILLSVFIPIFRMK